MVLALDHPNVRFIIHVDRRSDPGEFYTPRLRSLRNLVFMKRRLPINWGGFNMVQATLNMMVKAVNGGEKGYLVLLSGQDYPVKPASYIYQFLEENYGNEYFEHFEIPAGVWAMNGGMDRISYYWFIDRIGLDESIRLYDLQKTGVRTRPYFADFIPYGGAQWWALTQECADYILRYLAFNPIYKDFYESTYIPDEMFFQSIVLNSPLRGNAVNNSLRYIDWKTGPEYPRVLTVEDVKAMSDSNKLWARKFSGVKDPLVLDRIGEMLS